MRKFCIFFILTFLMSTIKTFAQDQCTISLNEAEDKYDQGRLYEIPEVIQSCINDGFTRDEKIRAYRLLTLTYLFLDFFAEADSSYLELLKISPDFKPNDELDPMELINQHDKFTTDPKYYLTAKIGINFSFANVLLDYSLSQSHNNSYKYSSVRGFQVGAGAEMVIYPKLHLSGEFFVSNMRLHLRDTHYGFLIPDMDIVHTELKLPVMLKYNFFLGKVNPFVSAGLSPGFLTKTSMQNIESVYLAPGEGNLPLQSPDDIITTKMKNRFNYSILLGGGITYKIGIYYLVLEARFSKGMLNVTDEKNRWREDFPEPEGRDLKFPPVVHIDDDLKINNLSFSI